MMRFGDKFTGSLEEHRELWSRYRRHLARCGFTLASPLYRYLAGEVFHDRPLDFGRVDLPGRRVELVLVNSYALNEVRLRLETSNPNVRLDPAHFVTRVSLLGVSCLSIEGWGCLPAPYYRQAELTRDPDRYGITIEIGDERSVEGEPAYLQMEFRDCMVEDLSSILEREYGIAPQEAPALFTSVDRDPDQW